MPIVLMSIVVESEYPFFYESLILWDFPQVFLNVRWYSVRVRMVNACEYDNYQREREFLNNSVYNDRRETCLSIFIYLYITYLSFFTLFFTCLSFFYFIFHTLYLLAYFLSIIYCFFYLYCIPYIYSCVSFILYIIFSFTFLYFSCFFSLHIMIFLAYFDLFYLHKYSELNY